MKKLLAFLLALTMVFCLCACEGGGSDKDDDDKKSGSSSNTFETPVELQYAFKNAGKCSDVWDEMLTMMNGCAEDELRTIVKTLEHSESFQRQTEELKESTQYEYDNCKDTYGDNYKFTYEIDGEKVEVEEGDLESAQQEIDRYASDIQDFLAEVEEYGEDAAYEDLGYELSMSADDVKDLIDAWEALGKALEDLKVEEGYYLTIAESISGSEVEEEDAEEATLKSFTVYKIGGRWVDYYTFINMLDDLTPNM